MIACLCQSPREPLLSAIDLTRASDRSCSFQTGRCERHSHCRIGDVAQNPAVKGAIGFACLGPASGVITAYPGRICSTSKPMSYAIGGLESSTFLMSGCGSSVALSATSVFPSRYKRSSVESQRLCAAPEQQVRRPTVTANNSKTGWKRSAGRRGAEARGNIDMWETYIA